ncbi:DUF4862 family protein [Cryobacterium sp. N19]|uniref:DUF4862 family protein n=1 Tax=Cryobacterium sp. N19 TaxID=2048288 RepID=UPI000CE3B9F9|nr:DUF4862 family protein [Cryobacterium sp. N19]
MTAVVVGAQVAQPDDPAVRPEFATRILDLPGVSGLEIAFGSRTWRDHDAEWLPQALIEGSRNTVSLMGITMERASSGFGFASVDEVCRLEAMQTAREARDFIERLHDKGSGTVAILLQTAPTIDPSRVRDATNALTRSVNELISWNWSGASIVIEHCDARHVGLPFLKGYLPLDEELRVVEDHGSAALGVAINWGRSAIEGRDATTPIAHAELAAASGALRGLMVSGVGNRDGPYGPAWTDSHPPARPTSARPLGEPTSALELAAIPEFLSAAGPNPLSFVGVKVAQRDLRTSIEDRVGIISAIVESLVPDRFVPRRRV